MTAARVGSEPVRRDVSPLASRGSVAYLTNQLLDFDTREPRYGGGESYCLALGALLRDLGFDVTFYQGGRSAFEDEYYGFRVVGIPFGRHLSEFQVGIGDDFYFETRDYDHVVYHLPTFASGRMRDDALLLCHAVWFDHDHTAPPVAFRTPEWFEHLWRAFSRPRQIVTVDTNTINVIRALWPDLTSRMTFIPNWVDTERFHPPARPRGGGRATVLFPRRSEYTRGSRLLGPILERVPHDCRFLWVGEGEPEETRRIRELAEHDPRLQFFAVPFEKMPDFYREADICVIPAVASEGTCLAALEGLASGCALIATNVGGLGDIVLPGLNGLMVDVDADQIAGAINRLIEDPAGRQRLQEAGPETAAQFGREIWRRRWTGLLEGLGWLDAPAPPAGRDSGSPADELTARRTVIARLASDTSESARLVDALCTDLNVPQPAGEPVPRSLSAFVGRYSEFRRESATRVEQLEAGVVRARSEVESWKRSHDYVQSLADASRVERGELQKTRAEVEAWKRSHDWVHAQAEASRIEMQRWRSTLFGRATIFYLKLRRAVGRRLFPRGR